MKDIIMVIVGGILFCQFSFSQNTSNQADRYAKPVKIPTMKQRYEIDYELVNSSLLGSDSLVLLMIEPEFIEKSRHETEDVIIRLPDDDIAILVYSYARVAINKEN